MVFIISRDPVERTEEIAEGGRRLMMEQAKTVRKFNLNSNFKVS
jgi:hypothetical protein